MKLVSVIIPVYNVYDYLDKCLNSIINQTYKSLEIIIVNDGSTDNSKDIIEKYSKIDKRITVINTKNNGLSVARNKGIDASHGDYLSFVDSDDYVDNDFIEYLVKLLEEYNSDISVCSFYQNDSNNKKEEIIVYNKIEAMKECIAYNNMYSSAWNKLYKKEIFKNIRYPKGMHYEDINTTFYLMEKSNIVVYSNQKKYHYITRNNSISNMKFNIKELDRITLSEEILNYTKKNYPKITINLLILLLLNRIEVTNKMIDAKYDNRKKFIKETKSIIKNNRKTILFSGYNTYSKIKILVYFFSSKIYYQLRKTVQSK